MKKLKVNRNIAWAETFVDELTSAGVKYACISPGSRSTPLTYAFITNKKVKSFAIIDERSGGFFALGLAKASFSPVALVCTSGTAVAEFYPAIIEACQSKIPLIVCTADRPPGSLTVGANQTINQDNIYKNHIRWYKDAGLPKVNTDGLNKIKNIAEKALFECSIKSRGPVHINFPFKEPFEPDNFTDEIPQHKLEAVGISNRVNLAIKRKDKSLSQAKIEAISIKIRKSTRGIILVGLDNYSKIFYKHCVKLSAKIRYPIFADAASNMRFFSHSKQNVLTNYDSYLRSEEFVNKHKPNLIIQFGRNFSSKALSNFIAKSSCEKLLVNATGEWNDKVNRLSSVVTAKPELFCRELVSVIARYSSLNDRSGWLNEFLQIDKAASKIKRNIIEQAAFPNESRIVSELAKIIPEDSNLMVSNSLPIRDLDLTASLTNKKINIYHNRGASGIDGIISTALGIAKSSKNKTFLLTGDLAFYYDLMSLQIAKKYLIPLTIILINNRGGRIFEVLPISDYKKIFEEYFVTPHGLEFKKFVGAFNGYYYEVKSWADFKKQLLKSQRIKNISVLEIKTNPKKSLSLRRKYFKKVISAYKHKLKKLL